MGSLKEPGQISAVELKAKIIQAHLTRNEAPGESHIFALSHAEITGRLELDGLFETGDDALIGLLFVGCRFHDPILLDGTRLSSLTFKNCRLRYIRGVRAEILGSLELIEVTSSEEPSAATGIYGPTNWHGVRGPKAIRETQKPSSQESISQPRCEINMRGLKLGGRVTIEESIFVARIPQEGIDQSNTRSKPAVNLNGATLQGGLIIQEHSAILGSLGIGGAHIGQMILITGSLIHGASQEAIRAQRVYIDGYMAIRSYQTADGPEYRSEIIGEVDMLNATVVSAIDLTGSYFDAVSHSTSAICLAHASIDQVISGTTQRGAQKGCTTEVKGSFDVRNAEVAHDLRVIADMAPIIRHDDVFHGDGLQAKGNLDLAGTWDGRVSLKYANIDGSLNLGLGNRRLLINVDGENQSAFEAYGSKIGAALAPNKLSLRTNVNMAELRDALSSKTVFRTRETALPFGDSLSLIEFGTEIEGTRHYGMVLRIGVKYFLLHGDGPFFFGPLRRAKLRLSTDKERIAYLRVFCGVVMGDAGPFRIVEPGDWFFQQLTVEQKGRVLPLEQKESEVAGKYKYEATVWYANGLFRSTFLLDPKKLTIEMTEDQLLAEELPSLTTVTRPMIRSNVGVNQYDDFWHLPSPVYQAEPKTQEIDPKLRKNLRRLIPPLKTYERERPTLSFQYVHSKRISDNDGNLWPDSARLDLTGLTYEELDITSGLGRVLRQRQTKRDLRRKERGQKAVLSPHLFYFFRVSLFSLVLALLVFVVWHLVSWLSSSAMLVAREIGWFVLAALAIRLVWVRRSRSLDAKVHRTVISRRIRWLRLQYLGLKPTSAEFNPQPFEQLARVLRQQGQQNESRRISRLRMSWQNRTATSLVWRPFVWLYGVGFGYGFSMKRSVITFIVALALGWWGALQMLERDILIIEGTASAANKSCQNEIIPALYAMDVFLPLIELGQEGRCRVISGQPTATLAAIAPTELDPTSLATYVPFVTSQIDRPLAHLRVLASGSNFWQVAATLYKLSGWIISSLLILTFTKVFRGSSSD